MAIEFWRDGFAKMCTVFPDGAECGSAKIVHCTPTEEEASFARLRSSIAGGGGLGRGVVRAGVTLTQLWVNGRMWMSDTGDERRDHWIPKRQGRGHVLIGGLGLGLVALHAALNEKVEKVTVIDINPDVVGLVEPRLRAAIEAQGMDPDRLEIIEADLFKWKPPKGQMYQCIWFDIWANLCTDNLKQYATLNRRFGRRTDGYRGAWGEDLLKCQRRQEKRRGW